MSWEAVGELVGAIAVLVTLLYLAMQIRQSTDQLAQSSDALTLSRRDSITASFSRWRQMVGADSEIWIRGNEDFDRRYSVRIVDLMMSDGARAWWSRNRQMYSNRFVAWVDQAIARDNDS